MNLEMKAPAHTSVSMAAQKREEVWRLQKSKTKMAKLNQRLIRLLRKPNWIDRVYYTADRQISPTQDLYVQYDELLDCLASSSGASLIPNLLYTQTWTLQLIYL